MSHFMVNLQLKVHRGEYEFVNVSTSVLEPESLFLVKDCLHKPHVFLHSSFEISPPLWLLRY